MVATFRDWGPLEMIHYLKLDHTKNPARSTEHLERTTWTKVSVRSSSHCSMLFAIDVDEIGEIEPAIRNGYNQSRALGTNMVSRFPET